ncbi:MAG: alginate export family protein [Terracidiphilus sp.]
MSSKMRMKGVAGLAGFLFLATGAWAQQSALNSQALVNSDYPQPSSQVQPLQFKSFPKWATLDMQIRAREENQSSDTYTSGNDAVYVLTRVWGGLEIRPAKNLTAYIQFVDAHALGLPLYYVASNQRDVFDGRQAFVEYHAKNVKIIAGRQELRYGNERLVGISNWTNTSRTWDGFVGRIGDKNRLDLFSTSVVAIHSSSLDKHGAGLTFHGAVGTITTWVPHTVIQPFVYFRALPRVASLQSTYGTETEWTPGAEISGKYPVGFYFDMLGALQRGSYANDTISAAAGIVKAGYYGQKIPWKPRLAGEYDYASGNPNMTSSSTRIGTFDQQYPSNHNAFGLTDLFGFQNIKQERINLDMAPAKKLTLLFQQEWLQVSTVHDSVYSGSGSAKVKPPTSGFTSVDIGKEFDASGQYAFARNNLTLNVGVGHFFPGTLMQKASSATRGKEYGSPLTLAYFGLTYKFKVERKK